MVKVSVIVPVYNPGSYIDDLIDSLLGQTMPAGEAELIFVDDGSTDGTGERLDALAAAHPHVKVEHIPNSGWPGRPRNVGLDAAEGAFVFFADNDDWLGREALERLYARAVMDDADIVMGKVVGHGKTVTRGLFSHNSHDLTARDAPFSLLAPHKLFRRAFLEEEGLRFPEGRRRLEDHALVVPAFFAARRIAILADYPCYHWVRRDDGENASSRRPDWDGYFTNVREVLDVVDERTEPGAYRDRLYQRWYRGKLLAWLGTAGFLNRDPEDRRALCQAAAALAAERFAPRLDAELPLALRQRAGLLRRGSFEGLDALARYTSAMRTTTRVRQVRGDGTWLTLRMTARLWSTGDDGPMLVTRFGDRLRLAAPAYVRELLEEDELDMTGAFGDGGAQVFLKAVDDGTEWDVPTESLVRLTEEDGDALRPQIKMLARIAPTTAAGGGPLPPGEYEVRAQLSVAGFSHTSRARREDERFTVTVTPNHRLEHWRPPAPPPPPPPPRRVRMRRAAGRAARQVPGVRPTFRRARRLSRAISAR
jgi:glycosyltransferase involved in cell wall biosynthesis